jgi:hypothetical protein
LPSAIAAALLCANAHQLLKAFDGEANRPRRIAQPHPPQLPRSCELVKPLRCASNPLRRRLPADYRRKRCRPIAAVKQRLQRRPLAVRQCGVAACRRPDNLSRCVCHFFFSTFLDCFSPFVPPSWQAKAKDNFCKSMKTFSARIETTPDKSLCENASHPHEYWSARRQKNLGQSNALSQCPNVFGG